MKRNSTVLIVAFGLLLSSSCGDKEKDCHKVITFKNTRNDTLFVVSSSQYPDTLNLEGIPNPLLDQSFTMVLPKENNTQVLRRRDCIELAFKDLIPSDTLMVYVFDSKVIEDSPWDTIKANYNVLKRYDLSLDDLKRMNWIITYQ